MYPRENKTYSYVILRIKTLKFVFAFKDTQLVYLNPNLQQHQIIKSIWSICIWQKKWILHRVGLTWFVENSSNEHFSVLWRGPNALGVKLIQKGTCFHTSSIYFISSSCAKDLCAGCRSVVAKSCLRVRVNDKLEANKTLVLVSGFLTSMAFHLSENKHILFSIANFVHNKTHPLHKIGELSQMTLPLADAKL